MTDPLLCMFATLPSAQPDAARAARVRAKCHAALERGRPRPAAKRRYAGFRLGAARRRSRRALPHGNDSFPGVARVHAACCDEALARFTVVHYQSWVTKQRPVTPRPGHRGLQERTSTGPLLRCKYRPHTGAAAFANSQDFVRGAIALSRRSRAPGDHEWLRPRISRASSLGSSAGQVQFIIVGGVAATPCMALRSQAHLRPRRRLRPVAGQHHQAG